MGAKVVYVVLIVTPSEVLRCVQDTNGTVFNDMGYGARYLEDRIERAQPRAGDAKALGIGEGELRT